MRLLLDTHALRWLLNADPRLPISVRDAVEDLNNEVYVSIVSLWEAAIKINKGKLQVPGQTVGFLIDQLESRRADILPVTATHIRGIERLPSVHGDPFDRMLIVQSEAENLVLVSVDGKIRDYPIQILWQ